MAKRITIRPMSVVAVKKWKDGSETVMEYFANVSDCLAWIQRQRHPKGDEFQWCVGEY